MLFTEPEFKDHRWATKVVNADSSALANTMIWFESDPGDFAASPTLEQVETLEELLLAFPYVYSQVFEALTREFADQVQGFDRYEVPLSEVSAILKAGPANVTSLAQLIIWRPQQGRINVGFDFNWDYDEEHGLGVRWSDGVVVLTGAAEVAHP